MSTPRVTIGIDIGTTAVKAVAADDDGNVVARARLPHPLLTPDPDLFEHDAGQAWAVGPRQALFDLRDLIRSQRRAHRDPQALRDKPEKK